MDKLKFNNMVITNKKKIQQVKAQTINKLVKKLHKLKTLLEKKPDEKNKQRFRKCQETMKQLKQLKIVDLVKRVLLLDKSSTAVLTNGRATPEDVAVAMLAENKIMQQMTKCFRDELKLGETDPSWKNELLQASKRSLKIIRSEEKRLKRTHIKEQRSIERKRNVWLQENVIQRDVDEEQNTNEDDTNNVSTSVGWKIAMIGEEANQQKEDKEKNEQQIVIKEFKKPSHYKESNKEVEKKKIQSLGFVRVASEKPLKLDINKKQLSITSLELSKQVENDTKHIKPRKEDSKAREAAESAASDNASESVTHVVDPFFITDTGENYLSTAVINRGENESQASKTEHTGPVVFGVTRANQRAEARNKQNGYIERPHRNRQVKPDNYKESKKTHQYQRKEVTAPAANLHPSWAAKQKQKPVITNFIGKKIMFDNND